jgi:chaperone required for assembly of F1-ATPase
MAVFARLGAGTIGSAERLTCGARASKTACHGRLVLGHYAGGPVSMRDIFEDIYANQPLDPSEAARKSLRTPLRKRFYKEAAAGAAEAGNYPVLLDGKPVRTPARNLLAAPTRELTAAIAGEWQAQTEAIDPVTMPLTRLANSIIDGVATSQKEVAAEVEKFLGTDLLFYRAEEPAGLVERQIKHWDPVIGWARDRLGARFVLAAGVIHRAQPEGAVASALSAIPRDPWRLGAVHAITTLTGSALLAIAVSERFVGAETAWLAAHVDEDWNMETWGRDEAAMARRAQRHAEMQAAATVLALTL